MEGSTELTHEGWVRLRAHPSNTLRSLKGGTICSPNAKETVIHTLQVLSRSPPAAALEFEGPGRSQLPGGEQVQGDAGGPGAGHEGGGDRGHGAAAELPGPRQGVCGHLRTLSRGP